MACSSFGISLLTGKMKLEALMERVCGPLSFSRAVIKSCIVLRSSESHYQPLILQTEMNKRIYTNTQRNL